jgi:hypothetical protein
MLQHGLKEMAGRRILVPRAPRLAPHAEFLEERYEVFLRV